VAAGADRLPVPVAVTGLTPKRYAKLVERSKLDDVRYFRGGKTAGLALDDPADIFPGSNLAATASYGDLTFGGVGTTTAVCGSEVLAFGHPMMFSGASSLTMHSADAVYVQEDRSWVPFKVANITGTVGNITDDRLAAINGEIGPLPPTASVTSQVDVTGGSSRTGTTNTTVPDLLPDIAAFGHLSNLDRVVDGITDGTARVRWIVRGTKPNGAPFTLDRTDRFASADDITFESIFEPWDQLFALQYFENGMPTITDVDFRAQVDDRLRAFRINSVDARQGGQWVRVRRGGNLVVNVGTDRSLRSVPAVDAVVAVVRRSIWAQARGERVDSKTDIYSLACVMCELPCRLPPAVIAGSRDCSSRRAGGSVTNTPTRGHAPTPTQTRPTLSRTQPHSSLGASRPVRTSSPTTRHKSRRTPHRKMTELPRQGSSFRP
jgi:hypothetical protein